MNIETQSIIVRYDESTDVLRVMRKDISNAIVNLDRDINTTLFVDIENRRVCGLMIANFRLVYAEICKRLLKADTATYMLAQLEIVLNKLTEALHLDQVIQREAEKSPVDQALKATLVGR